MTRIANAFVDGAAVVIAKVPARPWREVTTATHCSDLSDLLGSTSAIDWAALYESGHPVGDADITYRTVTSPTSRVFCAGFNYAAPGRDRPEFPTLFLRTPSSLVAHGESIVRPRVSNSLDWEGELGVVIGSAGRNLSPDQAWQHIAGFTCVADNTVRDYAKHGTQATAGKNFDRSGAIGPVMVTPDEMPPFDQSTITTRVNGVTVQSAPLSDMLVPVEDLISYLSDVLTLQPGDIIATGTPSGIGARQNPPRFLVAGDQVDIDVTAIGVLTVRVVDDDA